MTVTTLKVPFTGTARFSLAWGTGVIEPIMGPVDRVGQSDGVLVVSMEDPGHLPELVNSGVVGRESRVLAPGVDDQLTGPVILGCEGNLWEIGADVQVGSQYFLQVQDFATSDYLSIVGPTLVRIADENDFDVFCQTMDHALATGELPDFTTHPTVRLCDTSALGLTCSKNESWVRLHTRADGSISTTPAGAVLGSLGDSPETLAQSWAQLNASSARPDVVALAGTVEESRRVAALADRPWLPGVMTAMTALRGLRERDMDVNDLHVLGLGPWHSVDGEEDVVTRAHLTDGRRPALVAAGSKYYLFVPGSHRIFEVSPGAARVIEGLSRWGSVQGAVDAGVPQADIAEVIRRFSAVGVALGEVREA